MSAHTPGSWTYRRGDEWSLSVVTTHGALPDGSPNQWTIASMNTRRDEADANARLIAAAPELLNALRGVMQFIEQRALLDGDKILVDVRLGTARTAIAKAEGK